MCLFSSLTQICGYIFWIQSHTLSPGDYRSTSWGSSSLGWESLFYPITYICIHLSLLDIIRRSLNSPGVWGKQANLINMSNGFHNSFNSRNVIFFKNWSCWARPVEIDADGKKLCTSTRATLRGTAMGLYCLTLPVSLPPESHLRLFTLLSTINQITRR